VIDAIDFASTTGMAVDRPAGPRGDAPAQGEDQFRFLVVLGIEIAALR
jgi:hypothetical protein